MAHSAYEPRWADRPIPTLEDTYDLLMANSTRIIRLIERHMAIGHLLENPWEEARTLRDKTAHGTFLFDCLWRSEPDEARFVNLREWVAIVKTDAKSKLKALDFIRLRERKRRGAVPNYKKPCNPPSNVPTIQEASAYDTVISNATIGRLTEQAMPNIHRENGANVPYGIGTACGMDLEPGAQIGRIHTVQPSEQYGTITTYPRPRVITNTKDNTRAESHDRAGFRHELEPITEHRGIDRLVQHPAPQISSPTQHLALQSWRENSKTFPRDHTTQAHQWPRDATDSEIKRYPYPPPENSMSPYENVTHAFPGIDTMPLSTGIKHHDSHGRQTAWPQQASNLGGQTRAPKNNTRHRYLKTVNIVDDRNGKQRLAESRMSNPRAQHTSESKHRKRKHTTMRNT